MPPRRNISPDGNKDYAPFRTPMGGGISARDASMIHLRSKINLNRDNMVQMGVVSGPWKALAMFTAKLIRSGYADDALNAVNAAFKVASRAPRGPVASRLTGSVARSALSEAEAVVAGKPSSISYPGLSTVDAASQYRAMAQILGRYAGRFPVGTQGFNTFRAAGGVLKNQARLWREIK
jgi:hypothetical protein